MGQYSTVVEGIAALPPGRMIWKSVNPMDAAMTLSAVTPLVSPELNAENREVIKA
jgi:hypothetical protein